MVERAPGQHLEGISVSARRDMAERTVQVITNDNTFVALNGTTMKPGNIKITFSIYYMFGKSVSLFIYFNFNHRQGLFYFDFIILSSPNG